MSDDPKPEKSEHSNDDLSKIIKPNIPSLPGDGELIQESSVPDFEFTPPPPPPKEEPPADKEE